MKKENKLETKSVELEIVEVEEDAVIVLLDGWRVRAYFDKSLSVGSKDKARCGRLINVKYTGDLKDVHSVKLMNLTKEELD